MTILAIILFLSLVITVAGLFLGIYSNLRQQLALCKAGLWFLVAVLSGLSAIFLLRPHEDTFAGLDNSGYRLMARAFQAGRQMHEVDCLLLDAPIEIRKRFMLLPSMRERNTRDRSFLVKSLDTGETEPFFYPLLPLCAVGFDALVPGDALDYLVPVVGLIFVVALLLVGVTYGGWLGALLAAALLVGSPLPAWLLRGFYVESVASVLLTLSLLCWLTRPESRPVSRFAYLGLGLAVSFHPAMVVISVPLLMVFVLSSEEKLRNVLSGLLFFGAGFAVMVGMIVLACSPYGGLGLSALKHNFIASASHRITLFSVALMGVVAFVAVLTKSAWLARYQKLSESGKYAVTCLPLVLSVFPILYAAVFWSQKECVYRGLQEYGGGVRLWLGIVLALFCAQIFLSRRSTNARIALAVVFLALPVFAYLKGAEQMGLWSQRRLLPVYLLLVAGILPASAAWLQLLIHKTPRPMNMVAGGLAILILLAGGANPCRWPAPYTVRCDIGAWDWVENLRAKIGGRLVFFDYYPYSVPFAVTGKTRALGLCEGAEGKIAGIIKWLAEKAGKEQVLVATAYANPGVEEGMALNEVFSESISLKKIASKGALPAEKRTQAVDIRFLHVTPVQGSASLPVLNKILDDGPLAVRGPWGRGSPIKVDGQLLPARWSREGCGVVGPVPAPGDSARITIEAAASRDDGVDGQAIKIQPPWNGSACSLYVGNDFTRVSGNITRPADQKDDGVRTGLYKIYSEKPYDPLKAGIKGYDNDLGARIHLIRIESVP